MQSWERFIAANTFSIPQKCREQKPEVSFSYVGLIKQSSAALGKMIARRSSTSWAEHHYTFFTLFSK